MRPLLHVADPMLTKASNGCWYLFDPNDRSVGLHLLLHGEHEPFYAPLWCSLLQPHDTVLVVGSNYGYHDCDLARHVFHVWAFEPHPKVIPYLLRNLVMNGVAGRVTHVPMAVGDTEGLTRFHCLAQDYGGSGTTLLECNREKLETTMAVFQTTLDAYCATKEICPTVLKVDAEGAEVQVLAGARRLLDEGRFRLICLEHNPDYYSAAFEDAVADLQRRGFAMYTAMEDAGMVPAPPRGRVGDLPACDLVFRRC